jgi:hypothetical protein
LGRYSGICRVRRGDESGMKQWNERRGCFVRQRITNNNEHVRFLFEEMYRQQVHECDLSERVGFHRDTIRGWRCRYNPRVTDLEACLDYLGFKLKIVRKYKEEHEEN